MIKVAVIYNYIAHYRVPIFNLLSLSSSPHYTIIAGTNPEIDIKTASIELSGVKPSMGGINWLPITNFWFFKVFLWQSRAVREAFFGRFDTYIFLGNMYYISTWFSSIVLRIRGKRVLFWTHGFIRQENNLQGFVRKIFYSIPHELMVYGHRAKSILISKGFDSSNISVVYNSMNFNYQIKVKQEVDLSEGSFIKRDNLIAFIGRVTRRKNVLLLVLALKRLHSMGNYASLLIIGTGEEVKNLSAKVNELGLNNYVLFKGQCYDEKIIYSLLRKCKIVASPGEVGLTAVHAMTYGLPVVTHNRFDMQGPEFECIIPGVTGDFFDYYDAESSLSNVLLKWLNNPDCDGTSEKCQNQISKFYSPESQKDIFDGIV